MVCINYYKTILNSLYKLQEAKIVLLNINKFKGKKKNNSNSSLLEKPTRQ